MDLHIKEVWLPGAASCLLFSDSITCSSGLPLTRTDSSS